MPKTRISIELSESEAQEHHREAERLGVEPQDLALSAVLDLLQREPSDFAAASRYILRKNRDLYQGLA